MDQKKGIFKFLHKSRHGILGVTYHVFRVAEFITLIAIIGLTASFVSDMVNANVSPPSLLVALLSLAVLTEVYIIITSILFYDHKMAFKWALCFDSLILAGLIVIAVEAGQPLSYLRCSDIGTSENASTFVSTLSSLAGVLSSTKGSKAFSGFIASARHVCLEMKSIWGLIIANCIFFTFTVIIGALLSYMNRRTPKKTTDGDF
ncbi:hypothetical protein TMatcc_010711 [Talaromyces marneffei ATCC 18224]|uniref:MARVEL domain-containing protein n=2 Tax=Talaromyces marneffei TaxID=37727 RepID=B6QUU2_TALMQ|nr:uncharacterized protein EYB26_009527 [Talaromyces marneffei]EEA18747.1 conserved hypothetical protein [Talaromyces marneffei ATCC 18224]KAE8548471.1 hypothetical protein EYB25_008849 [Talaromyces marneffei]QGA21816.1 hypothetical protein EYB26_009527 [Talaromyces marneffei]